MRRKGAVDGSVEVEIVESDGDGDDGRASGSNPHQRPAWEGDRARRQMLRRVGVGSVVALAAVIGVAHVAETRRDADRRGALGDVPGLVGSLENPLREVWRVPATSVVAWNDTVVVVSDPARPSAQLGIALSSGEIVWTWLGPDGQHCIPVLDGEWPAAEPTELIACAVAPGAAATPEASGSGVVVLDVGTGAEVGSLTVPSGLAFVNSADGDLILMSVGPGSTVQVSRWDPRTGQQVWSYASEPGLWEVIASEGGGAYAIDNGVITFGDSALAISESTGAEVDLEQAWWADAPVAGGLPDGGSFETAYRNGVPLRTRVFDADGSRRFDVEAVPWLAMISDGSLTEVLPVRRTTGQEVVGLDAATGAELWTVGAMAGLEPVLQVDGVAVALGTSSAMGLELADGLRLWQVPIERSAGAWQPVSDGGLVLLLSREQGPLELAAHDVRTGARVWGVRVPDDARYLRSVGGAVVLVQTATEAVAFR